jgi:hypothetical protein
VIPLAVALTVNVHVLVTFVGFGKLNVIDVADPPDATVAVPAVEPLLVHVQTADCVQLIVTVAGTPELPAGSLSATGEPELVPPSGLNATLDLPRRSDIEIVPDALPARLRTFVWFNEICVVELSPSSTLTLAKDIAPVDGNVIY